MALNQSQTAYFDACAKEVLAAQGVRRMEEFVQHGETSRLRHSAAVAYVSFYLSCRLPVRMDQKSLITGALLHDYYLYDWHVKDGRKGLHGLRHPRCALENAQRDFALNSKERDIILHHMWPLTLRLMPRSREAALVSAADKLCSVVETLRLYKLFPSLRGQRLYQSNR